MPEVRYVMGIPIGIAVRDQDGIDVEMAFDWLREVDEFTTVEAADVAVVAVREVGRRMSLLRAGRGRRLGRSPG